MNLEEQIDEIVSLWRENISIADQETKGSLIRS
jgi:hypothetical protein